MITQEEFIDLTQEGITPVLGLQSKQKERRRLRAIL